MSPLHSATAGLAERPARVGAHSHCVTVRGPRPSLSLSSPSEQQTSIRAEFQGKCNAPQRMRPHSSYGMNGTTLPSFSFTCKLLPCVSVCSSASASSRPKLGQALAWSVLRPSALPDLHHQSGRAGSLCMASRPGEGGTSPEIQASGLSPAHTPTLFSPTITRWGSGINAVI